MPRRPPKEWFYYVVGELEKNPDVKDPKRLAGWLWHHFMKPETKRAILKGELLDPDAIIKVRKGLTKIPKALGFADIKSDGLLRILTRKTDYFPEFALYPKRKIDPQCLKDAGFTHEGRGKWVLRTNKFNIFVYI